VVPTPDDAAFGTVSHWHMDEWMVDGDGTPYKNDKQTAFEPYLDLPGAVDAPMKLALNLAGDDAERRRLQAKGWQIDDAHAATADPIGYAEFIRGCLAEFSCAKPSYVDLANAWVSDRTLCYLASGRPAVVQDTGPADELDAGAGLLRFATPAQAIEACREVVRDHAAHAAAARTLAETVFDGRVVVPRVLDVAGV
jgi:hypothetical protein